ncbi:RES family NAD+ phosphorylase [Ideonella azotifigens]|uniref:RES domain-containing protein n=1 Tax=Ideonella azotifigens TaxID=513160 RepID=A0ABN1JJD3_9BURK|nr:RES family NAD+ phosphorylase [Ideonella azotifigens]MCD2341971.1 RES family NAD+ phosphorylase [Ideonella azotifigens]
MTSVWRIGHCPAPQPAPSALLANWRDDQSISQRIGMAWLQSGASLALWVPSFVAPLEMNLLLNPAHPQYRQSVRPAAFLKFGVAAGLT